MLNNTKSSTRDYLIKQLPSATAFINTDFEVVHASNKWIELFDFSTSEVFGATLFELFGEAGERWRPILDNCFRGRCEGLNVDSHVDDDGVEVHIQWQKKPWYDENENIIGAIIQNENVTEHITNQHELGRLEAFLQEKSETAKIGSWESKVDGEIWWDDMTRKIHEVSPDYVPSLKTLFSFYKEGHSRKKISRAVKLARENGNPWSEKLQLITAKGNEKWIISSGKPLYKKGKLISLIGTFQDVTERVLKDARTRESESLLKTLIDHLPINVFIKDKDFKKVLVNKSELEYYGLENEHEMIGRDDSEFMDEESYRSCLEEDIYVLKNGKPILGKENIIIKKDKRVTTFLSSKIPMLDDYGEVVGLVGFSLDISDLKSQQEELRSLINVTSLQNKKLVDFAHIISHNLRSHAANFSMLLEFLQTEKNAEEKNKIIGMLTTASNGLLETIDNLNEVVAISTNTNLDKKPVFIKKTVDRTKKNLAVFLQKHKATVINEILENIKVDVVPEYLESILMNFITNGVKYRDPSRSPVIKLAVTTEKSSLVLSIEDNGLGIDLERHSDKLFGMYKTFHSNEDSRGIGLYISKNQIEAMNGKITVHSKVGVGTRFKIYFNGENQ